MGQTGIGAIKQVGARDMFQCAQTVLEFPSLPRFLFLKE